MKIRDRIEVLSMKDDPSWNKTIKCGDKGTITDINYVDLFKDTQIWVRFDNGSHLALLQKVDRFRVINYVR